MFAKLALKLLPWLLVVLLALAFWLVKMPNMGELRQPAEMEVNNTVILDKVEQLGKLELVKYSFREITELKQKGERIDIYVGWIPMGGDAEIVLFTNGEAVGCIDLTKMRAQDFEEVGDTIYVNLPDPELCYFKIDLENTRVYNFKADRYVDERSFLDSAYRTAERQIRQAALDSDILSQATENAKLILKPLLEEVSGKRILFRTSAPDFRSEPLD